MPLNVASMVCAAFFVVVVGVQSIQAGPVELSPGVTGVVQADVALDAAGSFHTVWLDSNGTLLYRSGPVGSISNPRTLRTEAGHINADPAIEVAGTAGPAFVWASASLDAPSAWNIHYSRSPTASPVAIVRDNTPDRHPVVTSRGDSLFVAWVRQGEPSQIAYTQITRTAGVSGMRILSEHSGAVTDPDIASGTDGRTWIAWTVNSQSGSDVWVAAVKGDTVETAPVAVRSGFGNDRNPSLACDADGRLHIVWQEGSQSGPILYTYGLFDERGQLAGFAPPATLTDGPASNPRIEFMSKGIPVAMWRNASSGDVELSVVVGRNALGPYILANARFEPDIAQVSDALFPTDFGTLIGSFIGRSPLTGRPGVWIAPFGEVPASAFLGEVEAEADYASVRISWLGRETVAGYQVVRETGDVALPDPSADPVTGRYAVVDTQPGAGAVRYRLMAFGQNGTVLGERLIDVEVPVRHRTLAVRAVPNPFNPVTTLQIGLPEDALVAIRIYDVTGRLIRSFGESWLSAGDHAVLWDGTSGSNRPTGSGVYFAVVEADGLHGRTRKTIRLTLVR